MRTNPLYETDSTGFVSLRWRILLPLGTVIVALVALAAYALTSRYTEDFASSEQNVLLQSAQSVTNQSSELYERQRGDTLRIALMSNIISALRTDDVEGLQTELQIILRNNEYDSLIVLNNDGELLAGVVSRGVGQYETLESEDYRQQPFVNTILDGDATSTTGLIEIDDAQHLFVAYPIENSGVQNGVVLLGQTLRTTLQTLRASAVTNVALYDLNGDILQTTLSLNVDIASDLSANRDIVLQALESSEPLQASLQLSDSNFWVLYTPFIYGGETLAVAATLLADNVAFSATAWRQMVAFVAALITGLVLIAAYILVNRAASRARTVALAADNFLNGQFDVRTNMKPQDEIGLVGRKLDEVADFTRDREDKFRTMLRRQRRERTYLISILEALPHGVVILDQDNYVMFMNRLARELLGEQDEFQRLKILDDLELQSVGKALATGIYELGDAQKISQQNAILNVHAAAVLSPGKTRIGTVLLVQDISQQVSERENQAKLLNRLSEDLQQLSNINEDNNEMISVFAREISRHAIALQKMIVDMRELTKYSRDDAQRRQRPLLADTLLLAVVNDWRQIALAAQLDLHLNLETKGIHIIGDESRLRWAIGNLVDNAIKYTPAGGSIAVETKEVIDGLLHMRVRDNGVGISKTDLDNVFTPFYRGTPTNDKQELIRVPGMGQGLPLAKQVIEAHGGLMKVKSRLGVGTAVYLALPVTESRDGALPLLDDEAMEGATIMLPQDADLEAIWNDS
jgi:two-component system sensor histidine kinase VicK